MKKENDNIIRLIVKSLRGELTPEEEALLLSWRTRLGANERMYRRLESEYREHAEYPLYEQFTTRQEWPVVMKGIHRKNVIRRIRRVAVAASVILLGVSSYLMFSPDREELPTLAKIEPVKDYSFSKKARLILPDGDTLQIIPVASDTLLKQLPFVGNNGNTLIYHATCQADTLIYNTLDIPRGGAYALQLADGTKVMLNSDSRLRFPQAFSGDTREVYLDGEAFFQVVKDTGKPFIVHCGRYDVRVLGTTFNISAYRDDKVSQTTLVEGKVTVECGRSVVTLLPGVMAEVAGDQVSARDVDVDSYISWTKDQFSFNEERLEDLLKKISRWYNVDFVYRDPEVKDYKFSGFIPRYESIMSLFEILEQSSGVRFTRKDDKICISKD